MNGITPFVRHMILCDHAQPNPKNAKSVDVFGLLSTIRSDASITAFPLAHSFTVYLMLTGGRGDGQMRIKVTIAGSGEQIYESPSCPIHFSNDPLKIFGVVIHVGTCSFPQTGLYWVEFWYNGEMIAHEPLEVA